MDKATTLTYTAVERNMIWTILAHLTSTEALSAPVLLKSSLHSFAKHWVDKYLSETCFAPFNILKRMIHGFGRLFRVTPRPEVVRWDSTNEILNLFSYEINLGLEHPSECLRKYQRLGREVSDSRN